MSKLDKLHPAPDPQMKAVIIYDDVALAAQANTTLLRVGDRDDVNVRWSIKPWRLKDLKVHNLGGEALMDAVDAQLIVLAGRRAESLPSWLHEWLARWANIRQIQDAAIAVIGNGNGGLPRPATAELSRFVRQHGLTFIIDEGPVAKDTVKLFVRYSRERKLPLPVMQSRFSEAAPHDSYRGWGIND
jgi:hypothetical protein